jgi:hypothetical protein
MKKPKMKINVPDNKNLNDSSIIFRVKSRIVNRQDLMDQNSTYIENSLFDCFVDGSQKFENISNFNNLKFGS